MLKKISLWFVILIVALTACGAARGAAPLPPDGSTTDFYGGGNTGVSDAMAPAATFAPASAPLGAEEAQRAALPADMAVAQLATTERLVIKNVNLSLVVKDPQATVDSITALAEGLGGFVVNSNVYQTATDAEGNKIMRASIAIRVPAAKLTETLAQLKGMAVSVTSENTSGEDVTAQYTDLESHLRNLEAAEQQLQNIMDGATKTEDVLSVYNQLVYIRDQIEQVKGQMKYYSEAAAMSLIAIDLAPDALSQPLEIGGWKPQGVAKEALEALVEAMQDLATAAIWGAVYCLPLALLFGLPGFFGLRWAWRKWRKPKTVTSA